MKEICHLQLHMYLFLRDDFLLEPQIGGRVLCIDFELTAAVDEQSWDSIYGVLQVKNTGFIEFDYFYTTMLMFAILC